MIEGKPRGKRGLLRRIAIGLLLSLLVLTAVIIVILTTTPGARLIALLANRLGSSEIRSIEIDSVGGLLGGNTRIGHLLINDADGDPWLLLKEIEIDWSPTAILTFGLDVERARVGNIEFARLPEADKSDENEIAAAFKLPLDIQIQQLELPDILVGEDIAGVVGRFAASGSFRANSDLSEIISDLAIERIDGVGGKVSLKADIDLPEEQFDLDLDFAEPAGGVLAHLAGLSKTDAVAITAKTAGRLSDWSLEIAGDINAERVANAHVAVRQRDNGHAYEVLANGALGRFMPPLLADLFAGDSEIISSGLVEPNSAGIQIDVFALNSSSLSAQGRGRLAREGTSNFKASVVGNDGPVRLNFGAGDKTNGGQLQNGNVLALADLTASVTGNASDARIQLQAGLTGVDVAGMSAENIAVSADLVGVDMVARSGSGRLDVSADTVGAVDPILARAFAGELKLASELAFDGDAVTTTNTMLTTATTRLQVIGEFDITSVTGNGRVEGRLSSAVLAADLPKTIGREIALAGDFALAEANAVSLDNLEIKADQLAITGNATIDEERNIAVKLVAGLDSIAALNPLATGALSLTADITGTVFAPEFGATLTGSDIAIQSRPVDDLKITANGAFEGASPRADVEISGRYLGQPIIGKARLAQRNGRNEINPLQLQVLDNRIVGALELDDAYRPTGTIDLVLPDLASLMALAGLEIAGQGQGQLVFSVENNVPLLAAQLAVAELAGDGFSLSSAKARATIDDYLAAPMVVGDVSIDAVNAGKTAIRNISVDIDLDDGWTRFDGKAEADGIPVNVAGRLQQQEGTTSIELDTARVTYRGLPVRLAEQARVNVKDGVAQIEQLTVSPGNGTVSVSGSAGQNLNLDVRLAAVPLTAVDAVAPGTGLRGAVSGTVKVTGPASQPAVRYDLTATGVGASALSQFASNPLSVNASGNYSGDAVSFSAAAKDGSGLTLNADGKVGLTGTKPLSVKANGTAPFSLLAATLASQGLVLDGAATVDMNVGGTLASPDYNGTIRSSGARFLDTTSGIAIKNLSTELSLNRQSVQVRSLSGQLSTGGELTGSGTIGLAAEAGYPADLDIKVANGRYADGNLVATRFNAALKVTGPLTRQPLLGGSLDLDQTTITVPDVLPGSISQLDVTHRNADSDVQAQAERLNKSSGDGAKGGLGLDLRINAPNRIFVRGRGIDAEFGGALTLRGSTAVPRASGGFELVRGKLDILGKRLDFDTGRITFAGSMIPTLDFAASTSAGTATATVLVTGPATKPEFSFTSTPALPEDEVLSLLIFGRSLSNLSPLQIAQLASAAAELTGITSGDGLVDRLRKATGIDSLDVKTDEDTGETSVSVGKYLNDRTYLGIEKGATAGSGKATIDLNIGRGLKLRGEASSEGETKGGIFFERDY